MKLLSYSRRQILRAIRTTCIALFLVSIVSRTQAQTFTTPFVVSAPTVTATTPGNYSGAVGFYDNVATYNSISVSSGVIVQNTANFASPIDGFNGVIAGATGTLTNAGTLSIDTPADGSQAAVILAQDADLTLTNSGTMTALDTTNTGSAAYLIQTGSHNTTATNSGLMSVAGADGSTTLYLTSVSGNLSVTNTGSIVLSNANSGYGVQEITGNNGNVTFSNSGSIVSTYAGAQLDTNMGTVQASNTGSIQVAGTFTNGIIVGAAGVINVDNNGTISGTNNADKAIKVSGGALPVTISNEGTMTGFNYDMVVFAAGQSSVTNTGTMTANTAGIFGLTAGGAAQTLVNNSGVINSTGSGIYYLSPATVRDSGNITSGGDSITLVNGSSLTLSGAPIINNVISGGPAQVGATSTIAFNLTVPAAQYAQAQADLNADLAQYAAQNGGNLTFDIAGLIYQISNFAPNGLANNLVPSRLYSNVPGFSGIGTAIDNFGINPTAVAILTALDNVSDPGLPAALAELSPKSLEVFRNVAFDNNTFYVGQINNHLANLRDGMTGFDSSALSVNASDVDPGLAPINDHLKTYRSSSRPGLTKDLIDPKDMKEMRDPKALQTASEIEPANRWSTFISGNVILANLNNSLPYQNSDYTTGAVTAGADYRLDDHWTVGALFSYAHTGVDLDYIGSKATVDSYAPGIYASYVDGGWYANGLATYVRNSYTEDRVIDIPGIGGTNHGGTSGNQGTCNLTGGYEFQSGAFKFGPVATVEYVHLDIGSFQEQGPTALNIYDQSVDSLRSLIGFEGRYATAVAVGSDRWILTPHASVSWQHEYLDNSNGITSQFISAGGGSFNVPTDQPERDSAFIDAGLDAQVSNAATVFIDYQVQAGQNDFFAQSIQAGVKISF